jgi:hypothetical protein
VEEEVEEEEEGAVVEKEEEDEKKEGSIRGFKDRSFFSHMAVAGYGRVGPFGPEKQKRKGKKSKWGEQEDE